MKNELWLTVHKAEIIVTFQILSCQINLIPIYAFQVFSQKCSIYL
jgi:hypothetical protein